MMNTKEICDVVTKLYLYADSTKFIHYSNKSNHIHELCDDLRSTITDFVDKLAETCFGYLGKPSYQDFTLDIKINKSDDIRELCDNINGLIAPVRTQCNNDKKLFGVVSLIDDFSSSLGKIKFLATFDKLSNK